jgi:hypothetical protein
MATIVDHDPRLPAGAPAAPAVEVYCRTCCEPRMHVDRHADERGTHPAHTCTVCGMRVDMTCTECGTRYQAPEAKYRTPPWLR